MTNIPIQAILWPSLCKLLGQPLQDVKGLGLLEALDTTALAMPDVVLQASKAIDHNLLACLSPGTLAVPTTE